MLLAALFAALGTALGGVAIRLRTKKIEDLGTHAKVRNIYASLAGTIIEFAAGVLFIFSAFFAANTAPTIIVAVLALVGFGFIIAMAQAILQNTNGIHGDLSSSM